MGGFYGTVALKTNDRPMVVSALEEIVRRSQSRFLVSPPIDGWISVYPDDSGQDEKVSRRIARRLTCDLVHLISHDEDIFLYFVYRQGKRVDQYSSHPGYFAEVTQAARRRLRGRPERFLDLFGEGSIVSVREVLDPPERPVFSSSIMKRFASLLKIPHEMMTSYDYLMEGETEEIDGWDQFRHVPDRSMEVARRRKEEDEVRESRRRLLEERILLVDRVTQRPAGVISHPVACPDRDGIGFLACPDAGLGGGTIEVERLGPPWSAGPSATGLIVESHVEDLVTSPSGRFLAIERGIAGWGTAIWDRDSGQLNEMASRVGGSHRVVFFPDESGWVGFAKNEVVVVPLDDRRESALWKVEGVSHGAIHPSGTVLVVARAANKLLLLDLRSGRVVNELLVGGLSQTSGFVVMTRMFAGLSQKVREIMTRYDADATQTTTARIKAERERRYAEGGIDSVLTSGTDELKPFLQIRQELAGLVPPLFAQGELFPGAESANAFYFDDAGDWLFCATDKGVRAYPWGKIVTAVGETPPPTYSVTPDPYIEDDGHGPAVPKVEIDLIYDTRRSVYDLAYDSTRRRLLFSTMGGQVGFLDVDGGRQGILVEPPGRPPMFRIHLSKDGSLLCCLCNPDRLGRARAKHKAYLQIWDYVELSGRIDRSPG